MGHIVHTERIEQYTIEIHHDDMSINFNENFDLLSTRVCWHNRYALSTDENHGFERDEFLAAAKRGKWEVLPLYLYDHSGITMNTKPFNCHWDNGQVGYAYVTPGQGRKEFGRKWRQKARGCMESEVKLFDTYLRGEIYGYVIEDEQGEHVDSCWGYFGRYDEQGGCLSEARNIIAHYLKEQENEELLFSNFPHC